MILARTVTATEILGLREGTALRINSQDELLQIVNKLALSVLKKHKTGLITLADAKHFLGFYRQVYHSKEGRVIKKNEHRKYFANRKLSIDALFQVVIQGNPKKRLADGFAPTELCNSIITEIYELFSTLEFSDSDAIFDPREIIIVPSTILSQVGHSDRIVLLHNILAYTGGKFVVALNRDEKDGNGRVYNTFTQISSQTRKLLSYINYDMDTAMQSIILHFVKEPAKYPLHQELVQDKRAFRKRFAEDANISIDEAKAHLTSLDNKTTFKGNGTIGNEYVKEAVMILKEVLQATKTNDLILYTRCEELAKYGKYDTVKEDKNPYSIYFHIWTHYEKQIRDVMKNCFREPDMAIDLHDAVYSREEVDTKVLEEAVLEATGFEVKISH